MSCLRLCGGKVPSVLPDRARPHDPAIGGQQCCRSEETAPHYDIDDNDWRHLDGTSEGIKSCRHQRLSEMDICIYLLTIILQRDEAFLQVLRQSLVITTQNLL